MHNNKRVSKVLCSMVVATFLAAGPAFAAEEPEEKNGTARAPQLNTASGQVWGDIRSEGQIAIGFRGVSQNGSESRYDKDIDLRSGVRILDTHWVLSPAQRGGDAWFDRAVIDIQGAGGDPYEIYNVSLSKAGKYRLDARTRKADFKWQVADSHNVWDSTRWYTDVGLTVTPTQNLDVYAKYGRFSDRGDNIGTVDISRNEFEVNMPSDVTSQSWALGARYNRNRTSVFFEQEFYELEDVRRRFSGPNTGLTPDAAELTAYNEAEVRGMNAPITKAGVNTWLADNRVQVNGDILYSKQTMDYAWDSLWTGLNYQRRAVDELEGSNGRSEREVLHGNVFGGFQAGRSAQVTVRYRHRSWDQNGGNIFTLANQFDDGESNLNSSAATSDYKITHNQFLGGAKGMFRQGSVYGEFGYASRDQVFVSPVTDRDRTTTPLTFRIGGTYRPNRTVDVKASYDFDDVDDPFARISPSKVNAFRVRVNTRPTMGLTVGGHYRYRKVDMRVDGGEFKQNGLGLHSTYSMAERGWFTVGYTRNDIDQMIPITFIFPFFGNATDSTALQELGTNVFTMAADFTVSDTVPFAVYGSLNLVNSDSDEAGVPSTMAVLEVVRLDFFDITAGARYRFSRGFFLDGELRFIDYQDASDLILGVDDYDAFIGTVKVGFMF